MTKLNKEPTRANDGYTQEFIKAKVNENGKPGVWTPLGDKAFWTSESMKLANMSEIIEGMEGDSLVTRELLQELGRLAIVGAESEKPELGKPYYYGDPGKYKSGDTVYGYYFKKYRPDKTQKYYEELFNPQAKDALLVNEKGPNSVAIRKALEDEVRARTEGQLIYHSDNPEIGLEEY